MIYTGGIGETKADQGGKRKKNNKKKAVFFVVTRWFGKLFHHNFSSQVRFFSVHQFVIYVYTYYCFKCFMGHHHTCTVIVVVISKYIKSRPDI